MLGLYRGQEAAAQLETGEACKRAHTHTHTHARTHALLAGVYSSVERQQHVQLLSYEDFSVFAYLRLCAHCCFACLLFASLDSFVGGDLSG